MNLLPRLRRKEEGEERGSEKRGERGGIYVGSVSCVQMFLCEFPGWKQGLGVGIKKSWRFLETYFVYDTMKIGEGEVFARISFRCLVSYGNIRSVYSSVDILDAQDILICLCIR